MRYFRQHELATELAEVNHRCEYLERDNAQLYAEMAALRQSALRAAELEDCRQRLSVATENASHMELVIAGYEHELKTMVATDSETKEEVAKLNELNRHLQQELRRLQERSMLHWLVA